MIKKIFKAVLLFGLILFPVFSFAFENTFYPYVPVQINDGKHNTLQLTDNVNFLLNDSYKVISIHTVGNYPRLSNIFWNGSGLYFIDSCEGGYSCTNINTSIKKQGFIQQYYECTLNNGICDVSNSPLKNIDNFINDNKYKNPDYMFIRNENWDESATFVCFKYENLNIQVCFQFDEKLGYYSNSLGFTYNPKPGQYGDSNSQIVDYFTSSPFTSSSVPTAPSIPDYEFNEDDTYTNEQIIQGYNAMGLTDEFCYGGFALDNIFEVGTVPQMFTGYRWGGGAFIFDIWDIYSGAYNNDYISFLRSFYISYENNNYSDFYGKTKAIYGFINQWFSVSSKGLGFIEATAPTFTLVDVWQYCDIKFNKNPDSIYTGNRWDPKFRYYTSGQVNLGGYFNFSGNNNYFSGNLSGFNTPKDFFASLNSIFQGGLNNLESREPVLPTYIIVFFLAIIFIRIISH